MAELCFSFVVVTASVPATASVAEGDGTVEVCATLTDVPAEGTAIVVTVMLTSSDGMIQ